MSSGIPVSGYTTSYPSVNPDLCVSVQPTDNSVYRRRAELLRPLVVELENENTFLAYKVTQTRRRIARKREELENERLKASSSTNTGFGFWGAGGGGKSKKAKSASKKKGGGGGGDQTPQVKREDQGQDSRIASPVKEATHQRSPRKSLSKTPQRASPVKPSAGPMDEDEIDDDY